MVVACAVVGVLLAGVLLVASYGSTLRSDLDGAESNAAPVESTGPWTLAHRDDFDHLDESVWGVYDGPGNGYTGPRDAANTFIDDGRLVLRTTTVDGEWHGAGVSSAPGGWTQTYGKYEARVRFEPGYGVRAVGLLWPIGEDWPPEIDFFEVAATRADRSEGMLTNHYLGGPKGRGFERLPVEADFTQWHTVGVEWTPGSLVYTLDSEVVGQMTENVPAEPMWLALATAQGLLEEGIVPDESRTPKVDLFVDWVQVHAYTGAR